MDHEIFVQQLKNPETYHLSKDSDIKVIQTHISFVILTEQFAYKVKKPVNFGFLDFSTLEKRKHYCEEELRLNFRLCPQIYEKVITFTETSDGTKIEINGDGPIVDYAVQMKQFPQENIMTNLLKQDQISNNLMDDLVETLVSFYEKSSTTDEISSYGTIEAVKKNIDENFEQTKDKINVTISKDQFLQIKKSNDLFFKKKKNELTNRKNQGFIKSCHGDLHSGNIVLVNESLCVFDCIEFNKRFRYIDVASDIGFLAMDLDIQNKPYLSSYFINKYIQKSNDTSVLEVLNLYKSYRAYVRGKVLGFQLDDPHIDQEKKQVLLQQISTYFDLSLYYASIMRIQIDHHQPLVIMMSGLTGTGKSTVAEKLAVDYHAIVINTDIVRKEEAGIDKYERHHDDPNTGMYSPERIQHTYKKVIQKAKEELDKGHNVILDATFQKRDHRRMARSLAETYDAVFIPVFCTCPESIAKKWLEERVKSKSVSDGRWEIYQIQKHSFDLFTDEEQPIIINSAELEIEQVLNMYTSIINRIKKVYYE